MTEQYGADWLTAGGIDDQWVTIRNPKFECVIDSNDPTQPFLILDLVPDDTELTAFEGQRFGIGANWEESDDGSEVTRTDGRRPQFHTSSKGGRLLNSFLMNGGAEKAQARAKAGTTDTPFQASWWDGIHGRIKENEGSFNDRESGEKVTYRYYTIEETDGWADGAGGGKKKAAKKAAAKKPAKKAAAKKPEPEPEPEPVEDEPVKSDSGDLEAQVREHCAATELDSHDEWMMAVYADIPDVGDDEALSALVDDPDAIWADCWSED